MPDEHRLTLVMEGLPRENGHVRLGDFIRELQLLTSILRKTERHMQRQGKQVTYFRVVDLSHSSPATVVVEAQTRDPLVDLRAPVIGKVVRLLEGISLHGAPPEPVSESLLRDLRDMARPVGKTLASVQIMGGSVQVDLDSDFRATVNELMAPEETYPGAVKGMLEAINLHAGANVFRVYPDIGPSKVTCRFPAELEATAVAAVGHFVEVRGLLKYKVNSPYPHEMQVDSIEAFPPEETLPTLMQVRGIAPNATGGISSEDFVRSVRSGAN